MGAYGIGSACVAWSISVSNQAAVFPSSKTSVFSSGGSSPRRFLPFLWPEGTGTGRVGCLAQVAMMENDASTTPLFYIPSTSRAVIASPCPCRVLKYPIGQVATRSRVLSHVFPPPQGAWSYKSSRPSPASEAGMASSLRRPRRGHHLRPPRGVLNGVATNPLWWISKKGLSSSPIPSCGPFRMKRKINVWWKGTNVNGERAALEIRTRPG